VRRDPAYAVHALNRVARTRWCEAIMSGPGRDVLAVQTLRNSVMASSLMASTAVLLIVGTLTLGGDVEKLSKACQALNLAGPADPQVHVVNLILLLADFCLAFFFFTMAVRYYNHVGYMINIPSAAPGDPLSPSAVAAYLNRAGRYYSLGTRTFYFCLPLVFWFFGPHMIVVATLVLLVALHLLDRPRERGPAA
jgi:uncharacterized membrane protein